MGGGGWGGVLHGPVWGAKLSERLHFSFGLSIIFFFTCQRCARGVGSPG